MVSLTVLILASHASVSTICEFTRCCQKSPALIPALKGTQNSSLVHPHSLWSRVQFACSVLDIEIAHDFGFSFRGSQAFDLTNLQPRELKPLLVQLARQAAYQNVDHRTRKDFFQPQGQLDFQATTCLLKERVVPSRSTVPPVVFVTPSLLGAFSQMTDFPLQDGLTPLNVVSATQLRRAWLTWCMTAQHFMP